MPWAPDDALLGTPDGRVWESTRANLFLIVGRELITPGLEGPILPGIQRALVIELAEMEGLIIRERNVYPADVDRADEVFLTNSVRGIVPVGHTAGGPIRAPGTLTESLLQAYARWIRDRKNRTPA
ncbi:MAG: aminotransferase class IV [Isosphaeraceae bacterium]